MNDPQLIKIRNGQLITPEKIIRGGTLLLREGRIKAIEEGDPEVEDALILDAHGLYISPGFVDIHIHGSGGHDFMDQEVEAFREITRILPAYGTTSIFPTTLTGSTEDILRTLEIFEESLAQNPPGAQMMGLHLEGPYLAMNQRGAQDPRYIRNPDPREYELIISRSPHIRRWSAAPELDGYLPFAHYAQSKGILVSMAHTDALYDEVLSAYENGCHLATHLYSGMSGVTRRNGFRYAGAIESALLLDDMAVEIIADGIHLPAPLLQLVFKIKGPERIALVTDAMRGAGMPPGESVIGNRETGMKVIIEDGVSKLPDRSAFAGSVATTDRLVRTMIREGGVSLVDAIRMMTLTPARIMNISDRKGELALQKDADLTFFDADIRIQATMIGGEVCYQADNFSFQ